MLGIQQVHQIFLMSDVRCQHRVTAGDLYGQGWLERLNNICICQVCGVQWSLDIIVQRLRCGTRVALSVEHRSNLYGQLQTHKAFQVSSLFEFCASEIIFRTTHQLFAASNC